MTSDAGPPDILMPTLVRLDDGTGVATHLRAMTEYVRSVGRTSTVFTPFSGRSLALYPVFAVRAPIRRVSPTAGVWWYRRWHGAFLGQALGNRLRQAGPTVIYAQCAVSAAQALRVRTTQPVVMAVHYSFSRAYEWVLKGEVRDGGRFHRWLERFEEETLPRLDGILYVSEFAKREVQSRIPAARAVPSVVVHHGVGPAAPGQAAPTRNLITVGSLEPRKNQAYLLDILAAAAKRGRRYTLTIVGAGPDRADLERAVSRLGLGEQVVLLGRHPNPRELLSAHQLYCHTAVAESFGIVLLEAMSAGLPVIAGRVGGIPEVVRAGRDGAFWPLDDAAAAAEILVDMMEDPARLSAMSTHATERAANQFSVEAMGVKLLAALDGFARRDEDGARRRPSMPDGFG